MTFITTRNEDGSINVPEMAWNHLWGMKDEFERILLRGLERNRDIDPILRIEIEDKNRIMELEKFVFEVASSSDDPKAINRIREKATSLLRGRKE
jgi:hypothetical protein